MFDKLTDEQIDKATTWWADRVCASVFDGLSDKERKKPHNRAYQIAEVMALSLVKPVEDSQREKFIEALEVGLRDSGYRPYYGLGVDYHPDRVLAAAAEKADVSLNNFPWKTHMQFYEDGSVKAALGYGAEFKTV